MSIDNLYNKNAQDFEIGWISPQGDTYNCGYSGHMDCAEDICEELYAPSQYPCMRLEELGWMKVGRDGYDTYVTVNNMTATQKQLDTLYDLDLWDNQYVEIIREISERKGR